MHGIIIIDKPSGMTSHDVVTRIKRITNAKKVGHGGTLDPLATGVLPILINDATKLADSLLGGDKEYLTTIKLGETTDTDDAKGKVIATAPVGEDVAQKLKSEVLKFCGVIEQVPPKYSAIKTSGQTSYKLARKGVDFVLAPRKVEVKEIEVVNVSLPFVTLRIRCSKGTYIRSIARDLGVALACGGHVFALRRLVHGNFTIEQAKKLDEIFTLQDVVDVLHAPQQI